MRLFFRCVLIATFAFSMNPANGDDAANVGDGPFADAIAFAQARTVKIYGAKSGRVAGFASGLIVSDDGQILTMDSVRLDGWRVRVTLPDGSTHEAKMLRRSWGVLQLALLKIEAKTPDFYAIDEKPVGQKGDWIVALSNAFKVADGPERLSVNLGIIALRTPLDARRGTQDYDYTGDVVLIDAITSNPGAPGGAVVTADGRLVGMIGKVIESNSTNTRLNYAIPSDVLHMYLSGKEPVVDTTKPGKKVSLGIRLFKLAGRNSPAYIDRVLRGSP
ncbi:MAG: serine protease, partial [Planctomycetes bacterium]|nr:serine protease [Planctomycetota bacterium]